MHKSKYDSLKAAADAISDLAQIIDTLEDFDADDLAQRVEESLARPLQEHREREAEKIKKSLDAISARIRKWIAKEVTPLFQLWKEPLPDDPIEVLEILRKRDPKRYDQPAVRELIETVKTRTATIQTVMEFEKRMSKRGLVSSKPPRAGKNPIGRPKCRK